MAVEEFKVILVGESGVGKTSFVIRFADSRFQNVYESTVGVDCKKVQVTVDETPVVLQVWDTAGQERFKSIVNRFFRSADGAIIMYDVTKKETFDEVPWWIKETKQHLTGIPIFLGLHFDSLCEKKIKHKSQLLNKMLGAVGNKNEDGSQPEVLDELAQDLAEENRLYLFQTSARDNVNVSEVFNQLAAMMLADRQKSREPDESTKLCERSIDSAYDVRKVFLASEQKMPKKSCCSYFESPETKAHVV